MNDATTKHSAEQRKAQAGALHAWIIDQVQQLADSGQWHKFLDFARSFHSYSLNNVLLILAQRPDATMVAGFLQWQAKGRPVRKGETSIKIFGYSTKKTTSPDEENATDQEERSVHYFPVLSVFDISQTDPIEGAPTPENPVQQLTGDHDHGVLEPLTAHVAATGWTVTREALTHANGYTDPDRRTVVLGRDLAPEQAAKTLIHEAAHIELGHADNLERYRQQRGLSTYSIGYITGWADEDLNLIRETASRVFKATQAIGDAIAQGQAYPA